MRMVSVLCVGGTGMPKWKGKPGERWCFTAKKPAKECTVKEVHAH